MFQALIKVLANAEQQDQVLGQLLPKQADATTEQGQPIKTQALDLARSLLITPPNKPKDLQTFPPHIHGFISSKGNSFGNLRFLLLSLHLN